MNRYLNVISCFIFMAVFCSLSVKSANASETHLGIYPPLIKIQATHPSTIQTPLSIKNYSNDPIELTVFLKTFTASSKKDGTVSYTSAPTKDAFIQNHVSILEENRKISALLLSPQEQKRFILQIEIPAEILFDDYYFSVIFISKDKQRNQLNTSYIKGGVASHILLSISPQDNGSEWYIKKFDKLASTPLSFVLEIQNTSNQLISPKGKIDIVNILGQTIETIDLAQVNVLAKSSRFIPDTISGSLTKVILGKKYFPGWYNAILTISIDKSSSRFTKKVHFVYAPRNFLLTLLIILIVFGYIVVRIKGR